MGAGRWPTLHRRHTVVDTANALWLGPVTRNVLGPDWLMPPLVFISPRGAREILVADVHANRRLSTAHPVGQSVAVVVATPAINRDVGVIRLRPKTAANAVL